MEDWHIKLTDGTTEIKALCVDPQGDMQSMRYLERVPLERTSMKLGSGRTQYSDLVPPWYSISQDDFSGGRAGKYQLDDPSKYADATGIQSWIPKRLVLGPQIHTDETWSQVFGSSPADSAAIPFYNGAVLAQTFTPQVNVTIDSFYIYYSTADADGTLIYGYIYDATAGEPDSELSQGYTEILTGAETGWKKVTLQFSVTLQGGTEYAIVVYKSSNGTGTLNLWGHATSNYTGQAYEWNTGLSQWDAHSTIADFSIRIPYTQTPIYGPSPDSYAEIPVNTIIAQTFTPDVNILVTEYQVYITTDAATVNRQLLFYLYSTSGGEPVTKISEGATPMLNGAYEGWITLTLLTPVYLVAGTTYAIGVALLSMKGGTGTLSIHGHTASQYSGQAWSGTLGSWSAHSTLADLTFAIGRQGDQTTNTQVFYFNYRGLLHAAISMGDTGTVLNRRGKIAMVTSATRNTLTDTTAAFYDWDDRVVKIVAGTGRGQWNVVLSHTTTVLTMEYDWDIIPDATSVYVSPGEWETISVIDSEITDVLVVDVTVYFARGHINYIKKYKWSAANGDEAIIDDGTNTAEHLALFRDTNNDPCVWRSNGYEISNAPIQSYSTAMTFEAAIRVGSQDSNITSIMVYDDHLYIGKTDGLYALQEEIVRMLPVDFAALKDETNCKRMVAWNLYLIFPLLESLERLYGTQVDDFGPNLGEGLPENRQGKVSHILPLPGALMVAIDAGMNGYSSIILYNNLGWHEVIRGGFAGQRIQSLAYETLPNGEIYLRWNEGNEQKYVWFSGSTFDRSRDSRADYEAWGELETGWLGTDLMDVQKIWSDVTIFGTGTIHVSYKLEDDDADWQAAELTEESTYIRYYEIDNEQARRLKLKMRLIRGDDDSTPVLEAVTIDALGRVRQANSYQTYVLLENMAINMQSKPESRDAKQIISQLDDWAATTTPLKMYNVLSEYNGKDVILEPMNIRIAEYNAQNTKRIITITLIEI